MPFVKVVKNNAYFRRYQVKYRRRREGVTDYYARKRLIIQDKNKYNSPKYRLVVRFTNKDCICQILSAEVLGDRVLTAAYSHELPKYGIPVGLTNYAAAYATGLLIARRALTILKLDDKYQGEKEATGKYFLVKAPNADSPRPFLVLLDVGLTRTTTGNRVFAAMKGAVDGGLKIPHNTKRLAGYDTEKNKFMPDVLRKYIYGGHVAEYMRFLQEKNPGKYTTHFSQFIKNKITADDLEKLYKTAHANIRKSPAFVKKPAKANPKRVRVNLKKLTYEQRKQRVQEKIKQLQASAQ